MQLQELKTDPEPFQDIGGTRKTFELRLDDRGFMQGDVLHLREHRRQTEEHGYTGRALLAHVLHLIRAPAYRISNGYVCMSIKLLTRFPKKDKDDE